MFNLQVPLTSSFHKMEQKTTAGKTLYRPLLAVNKKKYIYIYKYIDFCLRKAISPKKFLSFGDYQKLGSKGPSRIQKCWGSFLGYLYIKKSHMHE